MFLDNLFTSCNIVVGAVYLNKSKGNVLSLCFCASIFLFISIILFHIINLIIHDCKIDDFLRLIIMKILKMIIVIVKKNLKIFMMILTNSNQ